MVNVQDGARESQGKHAQIVVCQHAVLSPAAREQAAVRRLVYQLTEPVLHLDTHNTPASLFRVLLTCGSIEKSLSQRPVYVLHNYLIHSYGGHI